MNSFTFVSTLLLAVIVSCSATNERCSAHSATDFNVSISSRRNRTGHWVITMDALTARLDAATAHSSPGGVALDVSHGSASCGSDQYTRLSATAVYESLNKDGTTTSQYSVTAPELSTWTSSTTETPAPPVGYELRGGLGYYKFHTSPLNWEDARDTCVRDGGHLVVLNSEQEAEVVRKLWEENSRNIGSAARWRDEFHVGVSDIAQEGRWDTVLGSRLEDTGYVRWYGAEPNGGTGENCVVVDVGTGLGIGDRPCTLLLAFICEWRPQE